MFINVDTHINKIIVEFIAIFFWSDINLLSLSSSLKWVLLDDLTYTKFRIPFHIAEDFSRFFSKYEPVIIFVKWAISEADGGYFGDLGKCQSHDVRKSLTDGGYEIWQVDR